AARAATRGLPTGQPWQRRGARQKAWSVPCTKTSRVPAASEIAAGSEASCPPSDSHPYQVVPLSQRCHSVPPKPRTKTSIRPLLQDTADASDVGVPPKDSQCQPAPSRHRCQSAPSTPRTNASTRAPPQVDALGPKAAAPSE